MSDQNIQAILAHLNQLAEVSQKMKSHNKKNAELSALDAQVQHSVNSIRAILESYGFLSRE